MVEAVHVDLHACLPKALGYPKEPQVALVNLRERAHEGRNVSARAVEQRLACVRNGDRPLSLPGNNPREVDVGEHREDQPVYHVEWPLLERDVATKVEVVVDVRHGCPFAYGQAGSWYEAVCHERVQVGEI